MAKEQCRNDNRLIAGQVLLPLKPSRHVPLLSYKPALLAVASLTDIGTFILQECGPKSQNSAPNHPLQLSRCHGEEDSRCVAAVFPSHSDRLCILCHLPSYL